MKIVLLMAMVAIGLSGCGRLPFGGGNLFGGGLRGSPTDVDGIRFRSRVAVAEGDARSFTVATRRAGRALPLALEAGRVEGVRFCLTRFGGTVIAWRDGPDRSPDQVTLTEDGVLVLTGRCLSR